MKILSTILFFFLNLGFSQNLGFGLEREHGQIISPCFRQFRRNLLYHHLFFKLLSNNLLTNDLKVIYQL